MRLVGWIAAALPLTALLGSLGTAPAAAYPVPDYEAPFSCGETWVGTTRASHSPSRHSVDFNRDGDFGALTVAAAPGVVTRAVDLGDRSYGKYVVVDHGGEASSLYAHLEAHYVVSGQRVDQGAVLGLVGNSGGSYGAHLHFEERVAGEVSEPFFHQAPYAFGTPLASGNCPDVPLAGDWNGNGADEVAVFRRAAGSGVFRLTRPPHRPRRVLFGHGSDVPLVGDWDGDGRDEVGVRRAGRSTFRLRASDGTYQQLHFGRPSDVPVTGDWDGDRRSEVGVWRPSTSRFRLRLADGTVRVLSLGAVSSLPVTGDWNGDRVTDVATFDPSMGAFTLRTRATDRSVATTQIVSFGAGTDLPVAGDWDGDGRFDIGSWTPESARFALRRAAPNGSQATVTLQRFGAPRVR